ncbi:MAG: sodium:solute symporter family protein [Chitinophagaceae bacterium]
MSSLDWLVLVSTLVFIIAYGVYKSRGQKNLEGYFLDNHSMSWYVILLSIMGTQASAVTFLSAPGQAYTDGMRFVQYYFGLPLAMVVLCITFVPIFHRLKVYTAYEFLENRFDLKTRTLTSLLFQIQRGLSTGISIYAPSIILSALLGWNIYWTNLFMGSFLIIYTVSGGTRAVAQTQKLQMWIIFIGMFLTGWMVIHLLPKNMSFLDVLHVSGKLGKLNVIETKFNLTSEKFWKQKYNIWSGIIGGFFLALSYFGTDQSQVGRYLTAKSIRESRIGLLMNGLVKVPMQFLILLIGALLFVFYQFYSAPIFFNDAQVQKVYSSSYGRQFKNLDQQYKIIGLQKKSEVVQLIAAIHEKNKIQIQKADTSLIHSQFQSAIIRNQAKIVIKKEDASADLNDTNYIFLHFVVHHLPEGLVGLLIAIIFLAAWGSIAASLNSLASTSVVDIHKRFWKAPASDRRDLLLSRWYTLFWGIFAMLFAQFANQLGSLIEAVNVLGSLFYGTILGIFLVAFYIKKIQGNAVFSSAIITEILVILIYRANVISFLWLNAIGCGLVLLISWLIQIFTPNTKRNRNQLSLAG